MAKGGRIMEKKPFVTKEQLDEIVKKYPTPFHLYDEKGIRGVCMESGLPRIFCGKGNSKSIYFKHFKRVRLRMRLFFFNRADVSRFPGI